MKNVQKRRYDWKSVLRVYNGGKTMKFKKLLASVMTSILALGMLPLNAVSDNSEKSDSIGQVLADL